MTKIEKAKKQVMDNLENVRTFVVGITQDNGVENLDKMENAFHCGFVRGVSHHAAITLGENEFRLIPKDSAGDSKEEFVDKKK